MKEFIVIKPIPREELKDYKDYIGFLFRNQDGVFNICDSEEDIMKSNQWFLNFPVNSIVVSDEKINYGDRFLATSTSQELFGNIFTLVREGDEGILIVKDKNGKEVLTTPGILSGAYKALRATSREDKENLVNGIIHKMEI